VAAAILGILNWAVLQFVILPHMTQQERVDIYAGWMSTPYLMLFLSRSFWPLVGSRFSITHDSRRMEDESLYLGWRWGGSVES
jgi:hypothetical protein